MEPNVRWNAYARERLRSTECISRALHDERRQRHLFDDQSARRMGLAWRHQWKSQHGNTTDADVAGAG